ncbi:MAG: formiminoglutamase, partial [Cytophagales bacterium]
MDLTILFSPIPEPIYSQPYPNNSFFKNIRAYTEKMPNYKEAQIAIIGVKEERGTLNNQGCSKGPDEIRKKLYALKK